MNNHSQLKLFDENNQPSSTGLKVAINTLQRTLLVERMRVNIKYPVNRIIPYDIDNLYPQKVQAIAQRSGTTMSAIGTQSAFISGEGCNGMDIVVNRDGQTLWDILRFVSVQKSMFKGFALHFNYNIFGTITEINPVAFEFVRWSKNLDALIVNPDWPRMTRRNEEVEYKPFNPDSVLAEIEQCGGIETYTGQLFYWIPNAKDYYTTTHWDSVLDDAQFEAEAKLYSLSNIQNDYSLSGLITYPKPLESDQEIKDVKEDMQNDKGASNAGGIRVIGAMPTEGMQNWKWFTPISRNNIDGLFTKQLEIAKFNIYATFRQPPILNGVSNDGMFNAASFKDAFEYYNSATETERKDTERELTKIISNSIWYGLGEIKIVPKKFIDSAQTMTIEEINRKSLETRETAQANLRGTVGGVEGLLGLKEKLSTGLIDRESAISIITEIYGFSEEITQKIVGNSETQITKDSEPVNDTLTNLTGRQLQGVFRITRKYKTGDLTYDQAAVMLANGFGFNPEQVKVWLVNDDEEI
jgi:hypothetical protein